MASQSWQASCFPPGLSDAKTGSSHRASRALALRRLRNNRISADFGSAVDRTSDRACRILARAASRRATHGAFRRFLARGGLGELLRLGRTPGARLSQSLSLPGSRELGT